MERETLHVIDEQHRVCLVETKLRDDGADVGESPSRQRYQLDNHLGSTSLEIDDEGRVISYEEYYPFGGTAYHASHANVEVALRRYRYSGKERDNETGLYYFGARYYAAWLGRWAAADPSGLADGVNLFMFVRNSPIMLRDTDGRQSSSVDLVSEILERPKPLDLTQRWRSIHEDSLAAAGGELSVGEWLYLGHFSSTDAPAEVRLNRIVDPVSLSAAETREARELFGESEAALVRYSNFANRRMIVQHYTSTHPATVNLMMGLFRLSRDVNPVHFAFERGWQVAQGKEAFTGQDVSSLGAAAEFFVAIALIYGTSKGLGAGSACHRWCANL